MFRIMLPYSNVTIWDDFNMISYILTSLLSFSSSSEDLANGHSKNYMELLVLLLSSQPSDFLNPYVWFFLLKTVNREYEITNGRIKGPEQLTAILFLFNHPAFLFCFLLHVSIYAKAGRVIDDLFFIYPLITEYKS